MKPGITPGIASAVERAVHRGSSRPFGGGRRKTLPRNGLLLYLARPNSDAYITGETDEIPEAQYDWGYVLPETLFSELGEGVFFTADGVPIVALASEILADAGTNASHVLFKSISGDQQTGKLAIYDPAVDVAILIKAKKVLGIS